MDALRALLNLLRLGLRWEDLKTRAALHAQRTILAITLISFAVCIAGLAALILVYAIDRALAPHLGEVGAALLLTFALLALASTIMLFAHRMIFNKPSVPPPASTAPPEEMTTATLLALVGGIVVGTLLQNRGSAKE